jgi:uncharacterized protein
VSAFGHDKRGPSGFGEVVRIDLVEMMVRLWYKKYSKKDKSMGTLMTDIPVPKFVCDVHLGKLARLLRLLGFDVIYRNDLEDREIVRIGRADQRIVLTKDREILGNKTIRSFRPDSIFPDEQIREVMDAFDLSRDIRPFSRCLMCNGDILPVEKASVINEVPPRSGQWMELFWRCRGCGKIYWHGSHYDKMVATVGRIMNNAPHQENGK